MTQIDLTLTELEQGWHQSADYFSCNYCDAHFASDQVFPVDDAFYPAERMIQHHLQTAHPDATHLLIQTKSKYNTLTAKQQDLLAAFSQGTKDAEIAKQMGVAAATIRHQKFTFREKAKQAKLYLAIYNRVFQTTPAAETFISLPEQTGAVDDRFAITTRDYQQLTAKYFTSTTPLRLARWPKQQKAILVVLKQVVAVLPADQHFDEATLTQYLKPIYTDVPRLRRYLVDYNFLKRTADGRDYWRNPNYKELS